MAISVGRECGIRLAPCRSNVRCEQDEEKEVTRHEECSGSVQGRRKAQMQKSPDGRGFQCIYFAANQRMRNKIQVAQPRAEVVTAFERADLL